MVLRFDEPDRDRLEKEAYVKTLSELELRTLYEETRIAAQKARAKKNMEELYRLVRGTKTIQRIAGERGLIIRSHNRRRATS